MTISTVFRLIAIAIAVAGLADPAITREMAVRQPMTIAVLEPAGLASAQRLRSGLATSYDVTLQVHAADAAAGACPATGGCIVISAGAVPRRLTSGAKVIGAVRVGADAGPDIAITGLDGPARVSLHGGAVLNVQLRRTGARGQSHLQVFDEGVLVGEADYEWPPANESRVATADVAVEWVPMFAGARRLRVTADSSEEEASPGDNSADVGVDVSVEPIAIMMYEPEATWLGTFVRRSLDADRRFRLQTRTRLGPALAVSRGMTGPLTRTVLEGLGTIFVSAPASLVASEVVLLEQFIRVRGGSVVLLLDRAPSGPVVRLLPPLAGERREPAARVVGLLRASEIMTFDASAPGITVLERTDGRPTVVSRAIGRGRVVVSGAMDAWRYRDEPFARFWSALAADAAAAAGQSLEVTLGSAIVQPGRSTEVSVEWRTLDAIPASVTASGALVCGGQPPQPVRLWPDARPGVFAGTVSPQTAGRCEVRATIAAPSQPAGSASLLVAADVHRPPARPGALEGIIAAHGGVVAAEGDEAELVARVHEGLPAKRAPQEKRPMRSPWWMVPFAACLGAEWWMRRRRGQR